MTIPFAGVFYVARPLLKVDERKLRQIIQKKADEKNFKVALHGVTPKQKLVLETLSHNNDAVLKDIFAKQGVKYTYSPKNLPSPSPFGHILSFTEKLVSFLSH